MAVSVVDVQVQRPGIGDNIALDMFLGKFHTEANKFNFMFFVKLLSREFLYIYFEIRGEIESIRIRGHYLTDVWLGPHIQISFNLCEHLLHCYCDIMHVHYVRLFVDRRRVKP
jgi:hypothetical protein